MFSIFTNVMSRDTQSEHRFDKSQIIALEDVLVYSEGRPPLTCFRKITVDQCLNLSEHLIHRVLTRVTLVG